METPLNTDLNTLDFPRGVSLLRDPSAYRLRGDARELCIADRGYVLETGTISISGTAADIEKDDRIREAYLGI